MPFNGRVRPFTLLDLELLPVARMGVYGLFREGQWIYIGSGDIRSRLMAHFHGDNHAILAEKPTHYIAENAQDYEAREKQLLREIHPLCNELVTG
jgi:hypothetical protein